MLAVGCINLHSISHLNATVNAIFVAVKFINENNINVKHAFITNLQLLNALNLNRSYYDWRVEHDLNYLQGFLMNAGRPKNQAIPHSWAGVALKLPCHVACVHNLTLFHHGRDFPCWLLKCISSLGFTL